MPSLDAVIELPVYAVYTLSSEKTGELRNGCIFNLKKNQVYILTLAIKLSADAAYWTIFLVTWGVISTKKQLQVV